MNVKKALTAGAFLVFVFGGLSLLAMMIAIADGDGEMAFVLFAGGVYMAVIGILIFAVRDVLTHLEAHTAYLRALCRRWEAPVGPRQPAGTSPGPPGGMSDEQRAQRDCDLHAGRPV